MADQIREECASLVTGLGAEYKKDYKWHLAAGAALEKASDYQRTIFIKMPDKSSQLGLLDTLVAEEVERAQTKANLAEFNTQAQVKAAAQSEPAEDKFGIYIDKLADIAEAQAKIAEINAQSKPADSFWVFLKDFLQPLTPSFANPFAQRSHLKEA